MNEWQMNCKEFVFKYAQDLADGSLGYQSSTDGSLSYYLICLAMKFYY